MTSLHADSAVSEASTPGRRHREVERSTRASWRAPRVLFSLLLVALPGCGVCLPLLGIGASRLDVAHVAFLAFCGVIALAGGAGDWLYHRVHGVVGLAEHKAHVQALLSGGAPLFFIMVAATVVPHNGWLIVPALLAFAWTAWLVAYDELVYHRRRRPTRTETACHRALVFGNLGAFVGWAHACFA